MDSTTTYLILSVLLLCFAFWYRTRQDLGRHHKPTNEQKSSSDLVDGYPTVEPRLGFDWRSTQPLKFRTFKAKYHLTMAIENTTVSDLIEIDCNYVDRMHLRRKVMSDHSETVLAAEPEVGPAVNELYSFLTGTYLPCRFPTMFQLGTGDKHPRGVLYNTVLDETVSVHPPDSPLEALRTLGGICDDEFLFLLPSADGDGYTLKGFVTCFPSGFDTAKKLNLKLRDIHGPVPGYKEKLEKSMDRFFEKLPVGKFLKRANWTITTSNNLFVPHGNHLHSGEKVTEENVDPKEARLRCERQLLHRLPKTGAILFSFKTYLYTLDEIKEEGLGEELAQAIDGFKQGTVPDFHYYKKAVVWGTAVKEYLRQ